MKRMGQEMVEDVGGGFLLGDHVVEPQHDADRDRVDVGVHEAAAADALGAVADHGERRALVTGQVEPRLDGLPRQADHAFHAGRQVVQRLLSAAGPTSWAMKEFTPSAATTTADAQFVVAGLDADHPLAGGSVLGQHPVDPHPGHDENPCLFALLGQPGIELGPQHGDRVDRVGQPGVLVVDRRSSCRR